MLGTPLYFAGVTANNCVLASLVSAFRLGYQYYLISNCIGATSPKLLAASLAVVETYYGTALGSDLVNSDTVIASAQMTRRILYYVNGSIPSWRVMMTHHHTSVPYTRKRLHVMSNPKETRTEEFLAINPRGMAPTLLEPDDSVLIESMAILEYLHRHADGTGSYHPDKLNDPTARKAWTLKNQRFHETENIHNVFEDIELLCKEDCQESHVRRRVYEAYIATIVELRIWERYLDTGSTFIAGDQFGIADCAFFPCLAYLVHRGFDLQKEDGGFQRLKAYYECVDALPCALDARPKGYDKVGKSLFRKVHEIVEELETVGVPMEREVQLVSYFEAKMRRT